MLIFNDEEQHLVELPLDLAFTNPDSLLQLSIVVFDRPPSDLGVPFGRQEERYDHGRIPTRGARGFRLVDNQWIDAPAVVEKLSTRWFRSEPVRLDCRDFDSTVVRLASGVRVPLLGSREIVYVNDQGSLIEGDGPPLRLPFDAIGGLDWGEETFLIGRDGRLHSGSYSEGGFLPLGHEPKPVEALLGRVGSDIYVVDGDGAILRSSLTMTSSGAWVEVSPASIDPIPRPPFQYDLSLYDPEGYCHRGSFCQPPYDALIARGDRRPIHISATGDTSPPDLARLGEVVDAFDPWGRAANRDGLLAALWDGEDTRFVNQAGETVARLEKERVIDFVRIDGELVVSTEANGTGFVVDGRLCTLGLPTGIWIAVEPTLSGDGQAFWLWSEGEVHSVSVSRAFRYEACGPGCPL